MLYHQEISEKLHWVISNYDQEKSSFELKNPFIVFRFLQFQFHGYSKFL